MKEEIIQSVLEELLEGQKDTPVSIGLLTTAVEKQSDKITEIEDKVVKLKIEVPAPDLRPVEELLAAHNRKIQAIIAAQPKEMQQINRTVLFPIEGHKLEFYKAILGQFFKWGTILIIALVIIFKIEHYLK